MNMTVRNFPTVAQALQRKTASAPNAKTAENVKDPGPDSSHPASVGQDSGNLSVPEGDIPGKANSQTKEARPTTAVDPNDTAVTDTKPFTVNTDVGKDGSELSDLEPKDKATDPGPDSSHPASVPSEKYAACASAQDVLIILFGEIDALVKEAAAPAPTPTPAPGSAPTGEAQAAPRNRTEKVASVLEELIPVEQAGKQIRASYNAKVAAFTVPYVHAGIERPDRFAAFVKLAEADPAVAAEMMGGAPPMDPAAGGAPPMDPAMMGGDMGGAPGGDMGGAPAGGGEEELMAMIEQLAQEAGVPPEVLLEQLVSELQGAGGGGDAGAGSPPPADAGGPPADAGAPPAEEAAGGEKTAAAPGDAAVVTARRKIAQLLATEVGKTPKQVAQGC
jgi:hypothetical protein